MMYLNQSVKQFARFILETGNINTLNYLPEKQSPVFYWGLATSALCLAQIYIPASQKEEGALYTHQFRKTLLNSALADGSPKATLVSRLPKDSHFKTLAFSCTIKHFKFATQEAVRGSLVIYTDIVESFAIIF